MALGGLVGALLPASLVAATTTSAGAADDAMTWCSAPSPSAVCVDSASRDGVPITPMAGTWELSGRVFDFADGARQASADIQRDGDWELGKDALDDQMSITLRFTDRVPRVVSGKGRDVTVTRTQTGKSTYEVTVTGHPVTVSGQCDQSVWPWVCPEVGETSDPELQKQWDATFGVDVSDYGQWDDPAQRAAFHGMDFFTNIAATGIPPTLAFDAAGVGSIVIDMANRHFLGDGVTPVSGRAELRIPHTFLEEVYAISDPTALTPAGLTVVVGGTGGGSGTVAQDPSGDAVLVVVDGVTFTTRELRVERGAVTPARPKDLRARRVAPRKGVLRFEEARSRGSEVTRYVGRCERRGHGVKARDRETRIVVRGLRAGRAYPCKVRALSAAGAGRGSAPDRMKARP